MGEVGGDGPDVGSGCPSTTGGREGDVQRPSPDTGLRTSDVRTVPTRDRGRKQGRRRSSSRREDSVGCRGRVFREGKRRTIEFQL